MSVGYHFRPGSNPSHGRESMTQAGTNINTRRGFLTLAATRAIAFAGPADSLDGSKARTREPHWQVRGGDTPPPRQKGARDATLKMCSHARGINFGSGSKRSGTRPSFLKAFSPAARTRATRALIETFEEDSGCVGIAQRLHRALSYPPARLLR
jgi:hypothetical protein